MIPKLNKLSDENLLSAITPSKYHPRLQSGFRIICSHSPALQLLNSFQVKTIVHIPLFFFQKFSIILWLLSNINTEIRFLFAPNPLTRRVHCNPAESVFQFLLRYSLHSHNQKINVWMVSDSVLSLVLGLDYFEECRHIYKSTRTPENFRISTDCRDS